MNSKRLLNYEFLRDNVMCMEELDKQTAQKIKSVLLMACYDLSYLKFVDARFYVDTMGGDKVIIILGLMSEKHSTQVHFEVSADSHCCNAIIKRKFGIFELDRKNGTWNPMGKAELNDDAGELLSLIIKNMPSEFILKEDNDDLPVIKQEPNTKPDSKDSAFSNKQIEVLSEMFPRFKEEMDASVDNKFGEFAEKLQLWITDEFCPALQEWLEKALGRKLDVKFEDKVIGEPIPNKIPASDEEDKSNLI